MHLMKTRTGVMDYEMLANSACLAMQRHCGGRNSQPAHHYHQNYLGAHGCTLMKHTPNCNFVHDKRNHSNSPKTGFSKFLILFRCKFQCAFLPTPFDTGTKIHQSILYVLKLPDKKKKMFYCFWKPCFIPWERRGHAF